MSTDGREIRKTRGVVSRIDVWLGCGSAKAGDPFMYALPPGDSLSGHLAGRRGHFKRLADVPRGVGDIPDAWHTPIEPDSRFLVRAGSSLAAGKMRAPRRVSSGKKAGERLRGDSFETHSRPTRSDRCTV